MAAEAGAAAPPAAEDAETPAEPAPEPAPIMPTEAIVHPIGERALP